MSKLRVQAFSLSLDGYGAGPDQDADNPLGRGGEALHGWLSETNRPCSDHDRAAETTGPDDRFVARSLEDVGAWIIGRNMFGPQRGPWPDDGWRGWWGDVPPFHVPVFVLTHHPRAPIAMDGGTTFHFVTDGIEGALERARQAAEGRDVRVGGGVATVRQYLSAGLVDGMHLAVTPALLGRGEALLAGVDLRALGFEVAERVMSDRAMHVVLARHP